jgi:D-xylose transport system substrate-binding protein
MLNKTFVFGLAATMAVASACSRPQGGTPNDGKKQITIGLSMDTLKEERWQYDRDHFVKRAEELGAKVLVQSANNNATLQNSQAENLLTQGVDVLVVIPNNAKTAATIVESAHKSNVPVIAYDRLILDSDVDLYVSFDPERVGELQAGYLVAKQPKGNYVLIGGAPTDNNALLVRAGQMKVMKPLIDKGDIKIVADQWATDWQPVEALKIMENALTRNHNNVDGVVVSNDGTAGGAIQALSEQRLSGKVVVSGQDADLAACQRIVTGLQTMTVYKPIRKLARKGAEVAILLAQKKALTDPTRPLPNGKKDVPSLLLDPISVDKTNLVDTVVADGYQKLEEIYKDVPRDQWPSPPPKK